GAGPRSHHPSRGGENRGGVLRGVRHPPRVQPDLPVDGAGGSLVPAATLLEGAAPAADLLRQVGNPPAGERLVLAHLEPDARVGAEHGRKVLPPLRRVRAGVGARGEVLSSGRRRRSGSLPPPPAGRPTEEEAVGAAAMPARSAGPINGRIRSRACAGTGGRPSTARTAAWYAASSHPTAIPPPPRGQ